MNTRDRYGGLDGLRGLAALSVFFCHCFAMIPPGRVPAGIAHSPLHLFWDGTAAVDLFFVLSGFVLALPFVGERRKEIPYAGFVIRRIFRIYPVYLVTVGLAIFLRSEIYSPIGMAGLSGWVHFWSGPLSFSDLVRHVLMIGPSFDTNKIDPVVWSLVVEMRMSLLFPFILIGVRRVRSWRGALVTLGLSVGLSLGALRLGNGTLTFLPMFVLGALGAAFRAPLLERVGKLSGWTVATLLVLGLLLYDVRFSLFGLHFDYYAADLTIAAGSALLLALAAGSPRIVRALSGSKTRFLGKVSYSFYLIHLPILMVLTSRLRAHGVPLALSCAAALATSLAAAFVLERIIERPFHSLGRRLDPSARRLSLSPPAPSTAPTAPLIRSVAE